MNAGIAVFQYQSTPDNWESTIQVNNLGPFLLSLLLLPHLIKTGRQNPASATPRLVIVTSETHYWGTITKEEQTSPKILEKIGSKDYCTPSVMAARYVVSKLISIFFARALNTRISPSTPLIADTVNPGLCYSELNRSMPFLVKVIDWLTSKAFAFTSEEGSRQLVYAAIGGREDESQMRGAYVHLNKVAEVSDFVISEEGAKLQERIWVSHLLRWNPSVS